MHMIKCASHRARDRFLGHFGDRQSYWHPKENGHYGSYIVSDAELKVARAVKGVTKSRRPVGEWMQCWKMIGA